MSLESAFRSMILSISPVTALISDRLDAGVLQENSALPAIRYAPVADELVSSHDGPSGFEIQTIQVDCYAKTPEDAKALADAVKAGLDGFNGSSPATFAITLRSSIPVYEETPRMFRRQMDFVVQYEF